MFKRVKLLSSKEYAKKSLVWRICYEIANDLVDTEVDSKFIPSSNPLKWCLMDLINVAYLIAVGALMYLLLPIGAAMDAIKNKEVFENDNFELSLCDVIIPW